MQKLSAQSVLSTISDVLLKEQYSFSQLVQLCQTTQVRVELAIYCTFYCFLIKLFYARREIYVLEMIYQYYRWERKTLGFCQVCKAQSTAA